MALGACAPFSVQVLRLIGTHYEAGSSNKVCCYWRFVSHETGHVLRPMRTRLIFFKELTSAPPVHFLDGRCQVL